MVTSVAYAYPWDLVGDPAAAERIAGIGADAVALAASYHTVRAATPFHPARRVVDARHAALYVPIRPEAWRGNRLVPAPPSWVDGDDPFGAAASALRAVGRPVYAWTVLTHASRLGDAHPELTVRNAFGDRYPYALCPSNPDVVEYCRTLVAEIVHCGQPDGMVLEACGQLGFVHGGHHEKTDGADWTATQQQLLSLCFCAACERRYGDAGIDPAELRAAVRAAVTDGRADSVPEALGEELAASVSSVRAEVLRHLRQTLIGEIRALAPGTRIVLHASADEWATGPFAPVASDTGGEVDALTLTCWPGPERSVPAIRALRELVGPDARIAGYLLALPPRPVDGAALLAELLRYRAEGMAEFHLYHAGLASVDRLAAMRNALAGLRDAT
ncbi:hypothetical protein F0L68_29495 [Solihabitans fulvus]|uniref:Alanine-rich protein n=1 Tax=Solihabitans fulvus TaxID=1892852 RepID=A0A5B2WWT4_9PSEU|nr:hypothetical protein [Solihabitans fulvus]KAA2254916.1 hypothetical protein F0L68_29495 [Solihabitans fulvus]